MIYCPYHRLCDQMQTIHSHGRDWFSWWAVFVLYLCSPITRSKYCTYLQCNHCENLNKIRRCHCFKIRACPNSKELIDLHKNCERVYEQWALDFIESIIRLNSSEFSFFDVMTLLNPSNNHAVFDRYREGSSENYIFSWKIK